MVEGNELEPTLICGDSLSVLKDFPAESIDMAVTSPPYWMKREYLAGGIGLEEDWHDYIDSLVAICAEVYRVLKPTGSFWLNIGDSYHDKDLLLIPQRVAIRLTDEVGFTLRNQVVWNKLKGAPDNAKDKMRTLWEPVFSLPKNQKGITTMWMQFVRSRAKPKVSNMVQ